MLCRGVLVGYDEEVASRERFGFWLEKNNEGWGSITILRVIFKRGVKLFFLAKFLFLFGGSMEHFFRAERMVRGRWKYWESVFPVLRLDGLPHPYFSNYIFSGASK